MTKEEFKHQFFRWGMVFLFFAFIGSFFISVFISKENQNDMIKETYAQGGSYGVDVINFNRPIGIKECDSVNPSATGNVILKYTDKPYPNPDAQHTNPTAGSPSLFATKDNGSTWTDILAGGAVQKGTIVAFWGTTAPQGWAICDGTNGTPDLRGVFLRGCDNGRGVDPARAFGSYQDDALQKHNHNLQGYFSVQSGSDTQCLTPVTNSFNYTLPLVKDVLNANVANETRPVNVAINYIMKL